MERYAISFTPPLVGVVGFFNTFRLGMVWAKRLVIGECVIMTDARTGQIMGRAKVIGIHVGQMKAMANAYAFENHNHKNESAEVAATTLMASMVKTYGPHKCKETSKVTVIYLQADS